MRSIHDLILLSIIAETSHLTFLQIVTKYDKCEGAAAMTDVGHRTAIRKMIGNGLVRRDVNFRATKSGTSAGTHIITELGAQKLHEQATVLTALWGISDR